MIKKAQIIGCLLISGLLISLFPLESVHASNDVLGSTEEQWQTNLRVIGGEYEFSTDGAEYMEILQGVFEIRLPGEDTFTAYHAGDTFTIPKHTKFSVRTDSVSDYCCTYLSD